MQVMFWPLFWIKLAFSAAVTAAGFALAQRLARPGVKARAAWLALAAPVLAVWAIALAGWEFAPPSKHAAVLEEHAWPHCVFNIVKIAAPVLVAALLSAGPGGDLVAAGIFALASFTDALDEARRLAGIPEGTTGAFVRVTPPRGPRPMPGGYAREAVEGVSDALSELGEARVWALAPYEISDGW